MSKNTEYSIDPLVWFSEREMSFAPAHFVVTRSELTPEAKRWIYNTLRGRFSVVHVEEIGEWDSVFGMAVPAFEDPGEAVLYELTWSS